MPHWKGLVYGKDESRGLNCDSPSSIYVVKSDSLLHKWGFVDSQSVTNVCITLKFCFLSLKRPQIHTPVYELTVQNAGIVENSESMQKTSMEKTLVPFSSQLHVSYSHGHSLTYGY